MENKSIHYVDKHVGERLRKRRLILKISQERLAKCVNLTFQQIQKYEKGLNRISCSKLYEFAHFLKTDIEYFFQNSTKSYLPTGNEHNEELKDNNSNEQYIAFEGSKRNPDITKLSDDIDTLITHFAKIKSKEVREHVLNLIQSLNHEK